MFTGIIESMGELVKMEKEQNNIHFYIQSVLAQELKIDQSCLLYTSDAADES